MTKHKNIAFQHKCIICGELSGRSKYCKKHLSGSYTHSYLYKTKKEHKDYFKKLEAEFT